MLSVAAALGVATAGSGLAQSAGSSDPRRAFAGRRALEAQASDAESAAASATAPAVREH